jgi:hypothetical protein
MPKLAIFAVVCLAGSGLMAQDSPEGWVIPFAAAYQPNVAGFNARFAESDLPQARTRHFGWGIEVRSLVSGLLVGPLFFKTWDDVENADYQLRSDATAIFGEVGLKIAPLPLLTIVPMLGVGGLSESYSFRKKTGEIEFEELLGNPGQNAVIQSGMKLAGLAALELGLSVNTGGGSYGLAVRGGYLYSPVNVGWHLANGARILDTPGGHLGGLFFSLGLLIIPAAQTATTSRPLQP